MAIGSDRSGMFHGHFSHNHVAFVAIFISPYSGVLNLILKSMGSRGHLDHQCPSHAYSYHRFRYTGRRDYDPLLAALQAIPAELYEGCHGGWCRCSTAVLAFDHHGAQHDRFCSRTGIIGGFQIFERILLISRVVHSTLPTRSSIRSTMTRSRIWFGLATTSSSVLALFLLGASVLMLRQMKGRMIMRSFPLTKILIHLLLIVGSR